MGDFIDITLVANAGILVEHGGRGLLIDGIHHEDGHPFSKVPKDELEHMRTRTGQFSNLEYLLFTHEHPDHFTPELVQTLVDSGSARTLFVPQENGATPALSRLLSRLRQLGVAHRRLSLEPGQTRHFTLAYDLTVTVIGTRHMGPQYQDLRNDCFLLTLGAQRILFTADGDHVAQYYENALRGISLDAVFVNPLFFHHPDGQAIINDIFKPRHVLIYHLPFAQDDSMNFSYMVRRDVEKYARGDRITHVLGSERQRIRLYADGD